MPVVDLTSLVAGQGTSLPEPGTEAGTDRPAGGLVPVKAATKPAGWIEAAEGKPKWPASLASVHLSRYGGH
jgi:hypothetical protein